MALLEWMQKFFEGLSRNVLAQKISSWEKLQQYFEHGRNMIVEKNKICPICSFQAGVNSISDEMKKRLKKVERMELDLIGEILKQGRDAGEMNFAGEPADQAIMLVSAVKGALLYARIHDIKYYDQTVAQLIHSLQK